MVNQIKVKHDVKHWARVALDRMLEIQQESIRRMVPIAGG